MASMTRCILTAILPTVLLLGCAACGGHPDEHDSHPWRGEVTVHGALRAMFHEGQIGTMATLDTMLPNPDLYAVGALADLAGEVTVVGGMVYLSYPEGAEETRTETSFESDAGVTLLVATEVPAWHSVRVEETIPFEQLDDTIAQLAASAGINVDERFPFLLIGEFEDLRWHVIDGSRLTAGGSSHEDHQAASVQVRLDRVSATLVGFYSDGDQGVFTHMGSRTHVHCVLDRPLSTGHVDHVSIPAGTTLKFPRRLPAALSAGNQYPAAQPSLRDSDAPE